MWLSDGMSAGAVLAMIPGLVFRASKYCGAALAMLALVLPLDSIASETRLGIQAVVLGRWSRTSCSNLTAVLADPATVDEVELAFARDYNRGGDAYVNPRQIISDVLAQNPRKRLFVTVHLGKIHDKAMSKAVKNRLISQVRDLWTRLMEPVFSNVHCGADESARVVFVISPALEDKFSATGSQEALQTIADALPKGAMPYVECGRIRLRRSPDPGIEGGVIEISRIRTARRIRGEDGTARKVRYSLPVGHEYHGCPAEARKDRIYSNDGAVVFDSARDIRLRRGASPDEPRPLEEAGEEIPNLARDHVACEGSQVAYGIEEFRELRGRYSVLLLWRHPYNLYKEKVTKGGLKTFQTKSEAGDAHNRVDSNSPESASFNRTEAGILKWFLRK